MNPQDLRGSKTGVYIAYSNFGSPGELGETFEPDAQNTFGEEVLKMQGETKSLYANRLSYIFDFKGPSLVIDTACSSSLVAMDYAIKDLILGLLLDMILIFF